LLIFCVLAIFEVVMNIECSVSKNKNCKVELQISLHTAPAFRHVICSKTTRTYFIGNRHQFRLNTCKNCFKIPSHLNIFIWICLFSLKVDQFLLKQNKRTICQSEYL
jgi:hypothetical protein